MKKVLNISLCMIALMAFAMWAPDASAFQFYSDATNDQGGCAQCHTGFRDNGNYSSLAEGVSWGDSLHNVHLNNTNIDSNCGNCHFGAGTAGRTVNLGSSQAAADGVNAIACSGCHGRLEDANTVTTTGTGWGAGLRQHHFVNGETICLGCHEDSDPAAFTVAGEDVMPPFYASVTNDIVGSLLGSCNAAGKEQLAGDTIGLDNDGDNAYDMADTDCELPPGPTLEIPVQVPANSNGPVTVPVSYTANGNDISSMIFSVDFDETNLNFDPASTMGFPWPDAITVNPLISPFVFSVGITYDANDTDGELDFNFSDINPPLAALPDGDIVTITFTAGNPAELTDAPVVFSLDPPASFGNTAGASVPGVTLNGSVLIDVICTPTDTVDTTCDGIDDDCDTFIDDDFAPVATTCGVGECAATGQTTCSNGTPGNTCTPGTPTAEVCDNLDNDCNGLIDDNLTRTTSCGIGECAGNTGTETCTAGTWGGDTCDPVAGATAEVCDDLDNDCDGSTDENLTRPTTCGTGECGATGEETCSAGTWGNDTCTPGTPSAEVCDNLDNDCDGATDETLTRPTTCGVGECGATGQETCSAGTWGGDTCTPGTPSAEVCDNLDNDCDGSTDENLTRPTTCGTGECAATGEETCSAGTWDNDTCTPGTPSAEVCDNLDNDCDGSTDENLSRPTTCGTGECGATGQETCSAGTWGNDTCTPGTPSAEVCEGVLDENCDGAVDEGCDCIANIETRPCGSDVGECVPGIETCGSDGLWSGTCVGDVGPSAEVCDNLDNDCDGSTDENLSRPSTCGTGECGATGEETCSAGVWGNDTCTPGTPSAEICDNLDNDCNGSVDDNLTRPTTCGVGECGATGEETCSAGTWGGDTCTPGTPSAEICDNLDNDCDGSTDENLTRPTTCGVGECGATGEETCSAGTWGNDTCTPDAPSAEVCDNLDNDCDGSTDENLTRSTTCGVGECGATGQETCSAGTWGGDTCTPGTPSAEVCDNLDNDCDGAIDDNLTRPTTCGLGECGATGEETCSAGMWSNDTCTPGTPSPEVCEGVLDENCDGIVDEGCDCIANIETRPCGSDVGECVIGTETCGSDGKWSGICVNEVGPTAEVCDNLDNDCDGSTDENLSRATTCGTGECGATGQETCSAGIWGNDTCTPGTPSAEICDNLDNDCDGSTDENLSRATSCGIGECGATGEETCSAGMWGGDTCTPGTPSAEVCDNLDNDCDGAIDDNLTRPTTCGVGECGATGEETCSAGMWGGDTCTPGTPSAEICDNLDNDCDGATDENLSRATTCGVGECAATGEETCSAGMWGGDTCTPGTPSAEVCDNLDNDCDGATDENLSRPTTCGTGECGATGEETCSAGMWGNDTCTPGTPSAEVCEGSLDENCDGIVDEGCDCVADIQTRDCGSDVGECVKGTETCGSDGKWSGICVNEVGPTAEVCDNLDNDCDGSTDENLSRATTCGTGECGATGQETCNAGMWGNDTCTPGTPSAEICDDLDNDCDGSTDEMLTRPTSCGVGECAATGQETCNAGMWGGNTCTPGTPSAEVCDNLDNDCDGSTDENLTRPTTCGAGECAATGEETCSAGMWGGNTCTPGTPSIEICDSLDNDCDGATDENLTQPSTCGLGACAGNTGEIVCQNGTEVDTCDPFAGALPEGPPGDVTCGDTLDNDCDGQTDTGDSDCGGNIETECFDGADDDGDGLTDCADPDCDGATDGACSTGNACTTGTKTCGGGSGGETTKILYAVPSSGVNIANGIQTDHGSCSNSPSSAYVEELSTNLNDMCTTNYRYSQSSVGLHSEHYFNTAYVSDTTVTGVSYQFTIRDGGTFGIQLFYVISDGNRTYLGTEVTRSNPDGTSNNYTVDLSGQSGMVPTGAKLGLRTRLVSISGSDTRIYLGNPDGRTGNISGKLTVNESGGQGGAEICVPVNVSDGTACGDSSNTQCDNPDSCLAGTCVPNFEPSTTPCDDGEFCTDGDTCNVSGACTGGAASPCQTGETCDEVNDVCEPTGGGDCVIDDDCDDGVFCNGVEVCNTGQGQCQSGQPACNQGGEFCDEVNDVCVPNDCVIDDDCDDGLFCTGVETCKNGKCSSTSNPCSQGNEICDEANDMCVPPPECITDAECDDGLFCNGVETCDNGQCWSGEEPCSSCNVCDENQDTCSEVLLDLDIVKFTVGTSKDKRNKGKGKGGGNVPVGKPIRRIQLEVENPNGGCNQAAPATVTGVQDGKVVYSGTRMVWDLGTGRARFAFPNYTPIKKGTITWTADILDDDNDNDTATVTTRVR